MGGGGARNPRVTTLAHWAPARRRGGAPPWADGSEKGPGMRGHPPGAGDSSRVRVGACGHRNSGTPRGPGGRTAMQAVSVEGGAPTPGPSPVSLRPRSPGALPLHRQKWGPRGPPGSSDAACSGWWRWGEGRLGFQMCR